VAGDLTATVVGGGIAGLASAVSLAQAGWRVTVLERAPAFGEVGAGLGLTSNGMAALDALGIGEAARAAGHAGRSAGFQDRNGRWLLRLPDTRADLRRITAVWGIHRQRLHAALRRAAEGTELITGAEVSSVRPGSAEGDPAAVTYRSGTTGHRIVSDLVVAADGVHSAVRAQLFPGARPRYSGSTSWRAVIPDTDLDSRLVEAWGPGTEFGALRVSGTEVYWYGYFRHPEGAAFDDELAAARAHFSGWSPRIRAMVAATTAGQLMRHDVYHLPDGPPTYVRGRLVMIGDAAHAALPTAGQGAATALEDGVCVGRMIGAPVAAGSGLAPALAAFDQARRPRCQKIVRQAIMIARFGADLGGGWRQPVRNGLLRLAPAGAAVRLGAPIVRWTPPATAAHQ
jgi:2-polyprenyl-6-methoxyphenol hydroxylase-like FAD-dependent oxidoreductase